MLPDPLHPAVVHFPIVLAFFFPVVAGLLLWTSLKRGVDRKTWLICVVYSLVLAISARVAISTGESQEDVVEEVVAEDEIHEHEERAELFGVIAMVSVLISISGMMAGKIGVAGRAGTAIVSLVLLFQSLWVGKTGGELVYEHGAASAYVTTGTSGSGVEGGVAMPAREEAHDDDDDDD